MNADTSLGLGEGGAAALVADLQARHGARTIIVYGSRARGLGRPDSDLDVLALCPRTGEVRDTRLFRGVWLDAFISDESAFAITPEYLRLEGGLVLLESEPGRGAALLAEVEAVLARGPQQAPEDRAADRDWLWRMLDRVAVGGILGDARRAQLRDQLLPMWFGLRGRWFRGLPAGIVTLRAEAPADLAVLARALADGATAADLRAAVEVVVRDFA
jgi:hypothetical protein